IHIPVDKIREVIVTGGKVIRGIHDETGATIEITEEGIVRIGSTSAESGAAAKKMIVDIVKEPEVGEIYEGSVVGIQSFGAFVKLTPSKDGLLHISRVATGRVATVEDVLQVCDIVKVQVIEVDPKTGKISLDRLDKPEAPESGESNGRGGHGNKNNTSERRQPRRSHQM
ncbi:MAG: S1 RNA-binding domain-containing protein, partial [Eggerthellaceae bacterium]|nr:S1 RNA-binding domain-containing protein [Eggerthellaceae bacterium]